LSILKPSTHHEVCNDRLYHCRCAGGYLPERQRPGSPAGRSGFGWRCQSQYPPGRTARGNAPCRAGELSGQAGDLRSGQRVRCGQQPLCRSLYRSPLSRWLLQQ
uniref:Uncharacterized protein n=1 Tax=Anopheles coluzzii TaxID=1518534 RepID=A0A8W7PV07_ANOCL